MDTSVSLNSADQRVTINSDSQPALRFRLRSEAEAVLLCALDGRSRVQEDRLRKLISTEAFHWDRFWSYAGQQDVLPLVGQVINNLAREIPVADAVPAAREARLQTLLYNIALHRELKCVRELLSRHAIPVVPLKGTHITERLYGALDLRRCGDIDVLVRESDREAARSLLQSAGYSAADEVSPVTGNHPFHGMPLVRRSGSASFALELHWKLSDPSFVTIDYDQLWERVLTVGAPQEDLRPLPTEETLVFLALHLPKHDTGLLRLLIDIDRLIRREDASLDWPAAVALAESWSASGLLYFALRTVTQTLDTPVPDWVMRRLQPSLWRSAFVRVLAGPKVILQPPTHAHLRANRFRVAYCAMLYPSSRTVRAYWRYLFPRPACDGVDATWNNLGAARRLATGITWTGLVLLTAVADLLKQRVVRLFRRGYLLHSVGASS